MADPYADYFDPNYNPLKDPRYADLVSGKFSSLQDGYVFDALQNWTNQEKNQAAIDQTKANTAIDKFKLEAAQKNQEEESSLRKTMIDRLAQGHPIEEVVKDYYTTNGDVEKLYNLKKTQDQLEEQKNKRAEPKIMQHDGDLLSIDDSGNVKVIRAGQRKGDGSGNGEGTFSQRVFGPDGREGRMNPKTGQIKWMAKGITSVPRKAEDVIDFGDGQDSGKYQDTVSGPDSSILDSINAVFSAPSVRKSASAINDTKKKIPDGAIPTRRRY